MIRCLVLFLLLVLTPSDDRTISVTVLVTADSGPLAGAPLCLRGPDGQSFALTDASGHASMDLVVSSSTPLVMVLARQRPPEQGEADDASQARAQAAKQLLDAYSFEPYSRITLAPDQASYSVDIVARPARSVSLRAVRNGAPVVFAVVDASHSVTYKTTNRDGRTTLKGLRRDIATDLFVTDGRDTIHVTLPPGDSDVDLGDVEIPQSSEDVAVDIAVRRQTSLDLTYAGIFAGVSLVSDTGDRIISLPTIPRTGADPASTSKSPDLKQRVPAGIYHLAPGMFTGNAAQQRLLERIRGQESLQGIPRLEVVAGQTATLDFDAVQADQAILAP
jgi:hypothetical protein